MKVLYGVRMTSRRREHTGAGGSCRLARLLGRIADGDTAAAQDVARSYRDRCYGVAYRILGDRQSAEDVVQDVFLALLQGRARFSGRGAPEGFLMRVTTFTAIDRARRTRTRREKEAAMSRAGSRQPVWDAMEKKELKIELGKLLQELDPKVRAALALRFWEGATIRQIASILASTRGTVCRLIDTGLDRLKRPLLRKGFGAGIAVSLLTDLLEGVAAPPPSAGFGETLARALKSASARPPAAIPAIPEPAPILPVPLMKISVAGAIAAGLIVSVAYLAGLLRQGGRPQDSRSHQTAASGSKTGIAQDGGGDETSPAGAAGRAEPLRTVAVAGRVVGPDGRPVPGAIVRLGKGEGRFPLRLVRLMATLEEGPLATGRTDRRGGFVFRNLPAGSYRVTARAGEMVPGTTGLLRVAAGESLKQLRIQLAPGQTVEGLTRLASGEPVAGVRVDTFINVYMGEVSHDFWKETTVTGAEGTFHVRGVGTEPGELFAWSDTHAVVDLPKYARASGERVDIILARGFTLTGHVRTPEGRYAGRAEVRAFAPRMRGGRISRHEPWYLIKLVTADARGAFTLRGLPAEDVAVSAAKEGSLASAPVFLNPAEAAPGGGLELRLRSGAPIGGRLVLGGVPFGSGTGIAVPYPGDSYESRYPQLCMSLYYPSRDLKSYGAVTFPVSAAGRFVTPPLAEGRYVFAAYHNQEELNALLLGAIARSKSEELASIRAGQRDVTVAVPELPPVCRVAGRVVTGAGTPVAGARVRCSFQGGPGGDRTGISVYSDQRGVFDLEMPLPIEYSARCSFEALTPTAGVGRLKGAVLGEGKRLSNIQIVIGAGKAIAGVVLSDAGDPVPGATVFLEQDGNEPFPRAQQRRTRTNAQGRFRFGAVEPDRAYYLLASTEGWSHVEVRGVVVGTDDMVLVVHPEAVIKGQVVDVNGNEVAVSSIGVSRHVAGSSRACNFDHAFGKEGTGSFTVSGLAAGDYSVHAYGAPGPHGRRPVTEWSGKIPVGAGETVHGVVLTMTRLVAVKGQVVDKVTGHPVPGAIVADWDLTDEHFPDGRLRVTADSKGRFRLEGFQRGSTTLHAAADGYLHTEASVGIAGRDDVETRIEMSRATRLLVEIKDEGGSPVEGARVYSGIVWPPRHDLQTDAAGRVVVPVPAAGIKEAIERGRANLRIRAIGFAPAAIKVTPDLVAQGRVEVRLLRGGAITGRVVDHEGAAVSGIRVYAYRNRRGMGTHTNQTGTYRITSLAAGDYEVRLSSRRAPMPAFAQPATVFSGEATRVDFVIPDPAAFELYPVRIVTLFEDGTPAPDVELHLHEAWRGSGHTSERVEILPYYQQQTALRTGADGVLEILFEESDVTRLSLSGNFTRDGEFYQMAGSGSEKVIGGELRLTYRRVPQGTLTIRVVDAAAGDPVPRYKYMCRTEGHGGSGSTCRSPDGTITDRFHAGEVTVQITAEGYAPAEERLPLEDHSEKSLEVRLTPE